MTRPARLQASTLEHTELAIGHKQGYALLVNTSANVFGLAFPALMALIAIPYLVHELGIQVFGLFSLQLAILYFLGVADFGISRTIVLSASDRADHEAWRRPYRVGMFYTILLSAGLIAVSVPIGAVSWALGMGQEHAADLAVSTSITIVAAAFTLLCLPPRAILEIQNRFPILNAIRGLSSSALFLVPLCVISFSKSLTAIALSIAAARVCALVAFMWVSRAGLVHGDLQAWRTADDKPYRRHFLRRLGWIGLTNTVSPLLGHLDRFFVGALLSATAVGQYAIGHELATKVSLLVGAASSASFPRLVREGINAASEPFRHLVRTTTILTVLLGCVPSIGLVIFADDIIRIWLGDPHAYSSSVLPMQVLAIGIGINSLSQVNFSLLQVFGGERAGALLQIIQIPILVLLLVLLVPSYGLTGAAVAISTRLFIDGLILRWMLIKQHQARRVPGVKAGYIVVAALLGIGLVVVSQIH